MLAAILLPILLLVGPAPDVAAPPTASSQTTPTSKPAPANTEEKGGRNDALTTLKDSKFGRWATGQEQLTLEEAIKYQTWIGVVQDLVITGVKLIPSIFIALLFLIIFWLIYRGFRRMIIGNMTKAHVDSSIRDMLGAVLKWGIMGFGLVIACNQIGIQITALLTGVSLIGLAIGFAAQESLANFIAGIVIFWDKPFKVGDWIEVDGIFGQVQRITFRSTRLLDLDGMLVIMPNTAMLAHRVSNHSSYPHTRIHVPIGIAYKESIDDARRALLGLVKDDGRILADPHASAVVVACADSSVNLELRFWITDNSIEDAIRKEYIEKAKKALDAAGIQIPFPHLQLFLENTPALAALGGETPVLKAG